MRKLFTILVLMISVVLSGTHQSLAVASNSMPIAIDRPSTDIFGQDHYYSLTLRGNGDVLVSGRLLFSNTDSMPLSGYTLHIPSGKVNDITVYQVSRNRICEQYDSYDYPIYDQSYPNIKRPTPLNCIKYQEPAYYDYLSGQNTYTKATFTYSNNKINIFLPKAINPGGNAGILIFYRAQNITKKSILGAYTYEFQTLKVPSVIHTLQVGIAPDSDLYIKASKGRVQYNSSQHITSAIMKNDATGVSSPQLDTYHQQIGQGSVVKSASSLQPLDSYTVKGTYADAQWKLYGNEIGIAVLVFGVLIGLLIFVVKKLTKTSHLQSSRRTQSIILVGILSTVSTFCIVTYTVGVYVMIRMLQFGYYYQSSIIISLLVFVVSSGIYLILLIGPAVWIGVTRGIAYGVSTVMLTIFILGFVLVLIITGMFITNNPDTLPYPVPMGISGSTSTVAPDMK